MHPNEDEFLKDNFFVISSYNLNEIESRIYGYVFLEDKILINAKGEYEIPFDAAGCFISINKKENTIKIQQDYFRSYGLYVFQENNFFAISNSFLLLVRYLSNNNISFNIEFAKAFLTPQTAVLTYSDTLINEITMLPANCWLEIKNDGLNINYFMQNETYIKIDTKEGLEILDYWHDKWNYLIHQLLNKKQIVFADLSGGKDSRASFSILFEKTIDLNKLHIRTINDNLYTHNDDFKIAKQISAIYEFKINSNNYDSQEFGIDPDFAFLASMLTKCGFHKELMFPLAYNNKRVFRIAGICGDLRDLWAESFEEFITKNLNLVKFNSIDCKSSLKKMLERTIELALPELGPDKHTAKDIFYRKSRACNHFDKAQVELFLANIIPVSPLLDPLLYKLSQDIGKNNDYDLLYSLICIRYTPKIFDINFDSNRIIIPETKNIARTINKQFQYATQDKFYSNLTIIDNRINLKPNLNKNDVKPIQIIDTIMEFNELKNFIYTYFGEEIYSDAIKYDKYNQYHGYIQKLCLIELYMIWKESRNNINKLGHLQTKNLRHIEYHNNGFMREILDILHSARIEIRNFGSNDNDISITSISDLDAYIEYPKFWHIKNGNGVIVQSYKDRLNIEFKVIGNGLCDIKFMGPYLKTKQEKMCPVLIDFTHIKIVNLEKNENLLYITDSPITVSNEKYKIEKFNVINNHTYRLEVAWLPFIYSPENLKTLLNDLYDLRIEYFKFWKGVQTN